jgi:hypothetical protein
MPCLGITRSESIVGGCIVFGVSTSGFEVTFYAIAFLGQYSHHPHPFAIVHAIYRASQMEGRLSALPFVRRRFLSPASSKTRRNSSVIRHFLFPRTRGSVSHLPRYHDYTPGTSSFENVETKWPMSRLLYLANTPCAELGYTAKTNLFLVAGSPLTWNI